MENAIGKCGLACGVCKNFNIGCGGCVKQNIGQNICLIYNCAEEKSINYCLKCKDYPCNLMRGLSKAYCPVFTKFKID